MSKSWVSRLLCVGLIFAISGCSESDGMPGAAGTGGSGGAAGQGGVGGTGGSGAAGTGGAAGQGGVGGIAGFGGGGAGGGAGANAERFVSFSSSSTNLVANDTNGSSDVFVRDLVNGTTERVSVDSDGNQGNGNSSSSAISSDGRIVVFVSSADNLVDEDTNGVLDVFAHDRMTGVTTRVSRCGTTKTLCLGGFPANGRSALPAISADGRIVAFASDASNLVDDDTNDMKDVFVHDRMTGVTTRISRCGTTKTFCLGGFPADDDSTEPVLSADGRFVAFASFASNLVDDDTNDMKDVFVHDRMTGATTRVSVNSAGLQGDSFSSRPSISDEGRFIAFESGSDLVDQDTNDKLDVFVRDRDTGATTRVSVDSMGAQADDRSLRPAISGDGRFVAFASDATNLVDNDSEGFADAFVHDRMTGSTERISACRSVLLCAMPGQGGGDGNSGGLSISNDGRFVAFHSYATDLVASGVDLNGSQDIFVHDRTTGATSRVSVSSSGAQADANSFFPSLATGGPPP